METKKVNYFFEPKTCRLCDAKNLKIVIPLPALSLASPNIGESNVKVSAPADICQCQTCGFLQLASVVDHGFQYKNFLYKTCISLGLIEHFDLLMDKLEKMGALKKGASVFDIGSNDGSLLNLAKKRGARVLGIDPAIAIAKKASEQGIPTYGDFFSVSKAKEILQKHGKMDIIISNNTIANIHDLNDIFQGMHLLLADDGLVVIETQYALDVLTKKLLDVIYHEHISYFAVKPTRSFLAKLGFELIDAEPIAPKGGSIRFIIQKANGKRAISPNVQKMVQDEIDLGLYETSLFDSFNSYVKETRAKLQKNLKEIRKKTGHAFAFGSSVGCFALMHYFQLAEIIDKIFDDTPLCSHLDVNGREIPIEKGNDLVKYGSTSVAVLAWRYAKDISKKHQSYLDLGGQFFSVL